MSTKIYNARLAKMPMTEVHAALLDIKPTIADIGRKILSKKIAGLASGFFDEVSAGITSIDREDIGAERQKSLSTLSDVITQEYRKVCERVKITQTRRQRDPLVDTSFEIYVFPTPDYEHTLMICNCEQQEMLDILYNDGWNTDFHYQNSTDKPDDVSPEEWQYRAKTWDAAMPSGRPVDTCFTFGIFDGEPALNVDLNSIYEEIPDEDERIKALAKTACLSSEPHTGEIDVPKIVRAMMAYSSDSALQAKWADIVRPAIVPLELTTPLEKRAELSN